MKKIVMFGSYVTDLTGTAKRLPKAGETIFGEMFKMGPGGKGSNQAVAAHRAGADITMVTKLGKDVFGDYARKFYRDENIDLRYVLEDEEESTGIALINVDQNSGQNQILVVPGACTHFTEKDIETIRPAIEAADILLVQFEVNMDALEQVVDIAKQKGVTIVLNPAPAREITKELLCKATYITPNEFEAGILSGVTVEDESDAKKAADIFHRNGVENVLITMGERGVFVSAEGTQKMVPARLVKAVDTTGAGDAFNGGFVAALAENKGVFAAVEFGNALASLAVQKFGTAPAMPFRSEIDEIL